STGPRAHHPGARQPAPRGSGAGEQEMAKFLRVTLASDSDMPTSINFDEVEQIERNHEYLTVLIMKSLRRVIILENFSDIMDAVGGKGIDNPEQTEPPPRGWDVVGTSVGE